MEIFAGRGKGHASVASRQCILGQSELKDGWVWAPRPSQTSRCPDVAGLVVACQNGTAISHIFMYNSVGNTNILCSDICA